MTNQNKKILEFWNLPFNIKTGKHTYHVKPAFAEQKRIELDECCRIMQEIKAIIADEWIENEKYL